MSGIPNFYYNDDTDVDPFGNTTQGSDPFASSNIDPFAIPKPSQPTLNSGDDPFSPSPSSQLTNDNDPFANTDSTNNETSPDPFKTVLNEETTTKIEEQDELVTSVNAIEENDEEFKTEFKPTLPKSPLISINNEPIEDEEPPKEDLKETQIITDVEVECNQQIVNFFKESFTNTLVPQLEETEKEVNDLITVQTQLDGQLKLLFSQLKRMESSLTPPSFKEDMDRIIAIKKRVERLNATLNQIEIRISTLLGSRLYQKYSNQIIIPE
ncbi:Uncharacterized protein QTN25_002773 [Entamoeba marina]